MGCDLFLLFLALYRGHGHPRSNGRPSMRAETKRGHEEPAKESLDTFNLGLRLMAGTFILFMLVSLFYLYVAVGSSLSLVLSALLDSRILGAMWVSVSSAFIVGALAIVVAIPTAYVLTYSEFRGKSLVETLLIEFPQTFPPATVGLVYLLMLGPGSPINIAYTYPAVPEGLIVVRLRPELRRSSPSWGW